MTSSTGDNPVLVTGAGGFIGAHVVRRLLATGRTVVALLRPGGSDLRLRNSGTGLIIARGDLAAPESLAAAFAAHRPSVVINAAAYGADPRQSDPAQCFTINVGGLVSLVELGARNGLRRFVQLGSCFEYGTVETPAEETRPLRPMSAYAASKAAATWTLAPLARALGVEAISLRLFGVWGPGESPNRLAPQIIAASKTRRRLSLTPGLQIRDLSYVEDVAGKVADVAWNAGFARHPVVNIASGRPVTIRSFAESIAAQLGADDLLDFAGLPYRTDESMYLAADTTRQRDLFGDVTETPVQAGVQAMLREPS